MWRFREELIQEKLTRQDLEQSLWRAADILRGAVKPEKYGNYMLGVLTEAGRTSYQPNSSAEAVLAIQDRESTDCVFEKANFLLGQAKKEEGSSEESCS